LIFFSDSKQRICASSTAASSATLIYTGPIEGTIPNGTVLTWSNGIQSTQTAQANPDGEFSALVVSALSGSIAAKHTTDAPWTNSLFPVNLGATGTITVTPDPGGNYTGEPVGFGEI
jgi:hypothetical protein